MLYAPVQKPKEDKNQPNIWMSDMCCMPQSKSPKRIKINQIFGCLTCVVCPSPKAQRIKINQIFGCLTCVVCPSLKTQLVRNQPNIWMSDQCCMPQSKSPKRIKINQIFGCLTCVVCPSLKTQLVRNQPNIQMSHLDFVLPQPKLQTGTCSLENTTQGMMWQQKEIACLI